MISDHNILKSRGFGSTHVPLIEANCAMIITKISSLGLKQKFLLPKDQKVNVNSVCNDVQMYMPGRI